MAGDGLIVPDLPANTMPDYLIHAGMSGLLDNISEQINIYLNILKGMTRRHYIDPGFCRRRDVTPLCSPLDAVISLFNGSLRRICFE